MSQGDYLIEINSIMQGDWVGLHHLDIHPNCCYGDPAVSMCEEVSGDGGRGKEEVKRREIVFFYSVVHNMSNSSAN